MSMTKISLRYFSGVQDQPQVLRSEIDDSALAVEALTNELVVRGASDGYQLAIAITEISGEEDKLGTPHLYFWIDRVSVRELKQIFGASLDAEPPLLALYPGGIGNGFSEVVYESLADLLAAFGQPSRVLIGAKAAAREAARVRHSELREEIRNWANTGEISRKLVLLVRVRPEWEARRFQRLTGLTDRFRAAALLRHAGFVLDDRWDDETWYRRTSDDSDSA